MKILKKRKSEIKLEDFNCCPGKDRFLEALEGIKYLAVDLKTTGQYQGYRNEHDTAIILISKKNSFEQMIDLLDSVSGMRPDEFASIQLESGNMVLRLWWD